VPDTLIFSIWPTLYRLALRLETTIVGALQSVLATGGAGCVAIGAGLTTGPGVGVFAMVTVAFAASLVPPWPAPARTSTRISSSTDGVAAGSVLVVAPSIARSLRNQV
jgi:hypothetical protein